MVFPKAPFNVIIGGDLSAEKLLAIQSLAGIADTIVLLGKIGVKIL